jgi:TfoX/Sxy family transcriptional regulator of competence genes
MVLKSQYEIVMEEFTRQGKVKFYTEEESMEINLQLATSEEEIWEHKKKMVESAQELKNIFLD